MTALFAQAWACQPHAAVIAGPVVESHPAVDRVLDTVQIGPNVAGLCGGAPGSICKAANPASMNSAALKYITRAPDSVRAQLPGQPGILTNGAYGVFGNGAH